MRGKDDGVAGITQSMGITPAYAGKRLYIFPQTTLDRDHPRLCGEKFVKRFLLIKNIGSPPPMRGKGSCDALITSCARITPAYAGKREMGGGKAGGGKDHPRLCGEKGEKVGDAIGGTGSPPPMRGKAAATLLGTILTGITPAYAGKSCRKA